MWLTDNQCPCASFTASPRAAGSDTAAIKYHDIVLTVCRTASAAVPFSVFHSHASQQLRLIDE